jgi:predicted transcriptional regulator
VQPAVARHSLHRGAVQYRGRATAAERWSVGRLSRACGIISAMDTAKEQVRQLLEVLPDDSTFEDIQYHIYVRQKIEQGLADVEAGRTIPHEEVVRRLSKWRA